MLFILRSTYVHLVLGKPHDLSIKGKQRAFKTPLYKMSAFPSCKFNPNFKLSTGGSITTINCFICLGQTEQMLGEREREREREGEINKVKSFQKLFLAV